MDLKVLTNLRRGRRPVLLGRALACRTTAAVRHSLVVVVFWSGTTVSWPSSGWTARGAVVCVRSRDTLLPVERAASPCRHDRRPTAKPGRPSRSLLIRRQGSRCRWRGIGGRGATGSAGRARAAGPGERGFPGGSYLSGPGRTRRTARCLRGKRAGLLLGEGGEGRTERGTLNRPARAGRTLAATPGT